MNKNNEYVFLLNTEKLKCFTYYDLTKIMPMSNTTIKNFLNFFTERLFLVKHQEGRRIIYTPTNFYKMYILAYKTAYSMKYGKK